jgi:outer membrane protein OmpA-like peptidoglycan-associated protein
LIRVAQSLKQYPQYQIKIIGHTELLGAADYAEEIALQRAQALQAFWIAQGVLAKQLSVDSRGQRQPMAENVTPYGRWLNRRMMFEVTEQTNSTNPAAP